MDTFFLPLPCPLPPLQPSMPLTGRQLWIIKWRIRAYFLPTQTGGGVAGSLAVGLIPLSTRNTPKSRRCPSSFNRKTVDSTRSSPRQLHARINKAGMLRGEIPAVMRSSSPLMLMNFSLLLLTWQRVITCDHTDG